MICVICNKPAVCVYAGYSVCFAHLAALEWRDLQFDVEDVVRTLMKNEKT